MPSSCRAARSTGGPTSTWSASATSPNTRARTRDSPGSFGSAYLYFVVPRVILFHQEHSPRTLPAKVDFVSAPGTSAPEVYRPGGPYALVTSLSVFRFDRGRGRFSLASTHPGVSAAQVKSATGFDYDAPGSVPVTPSPDADTLALLRTEVAALIADTYPGFAARTWGVSAPKSA